MNRQAAPVAQAAVGTDFDQAANVLVDLSP
jgi:hypothetical protein